MHSEFTLGEWQEHMPVSGPCKHLLEARQREGMQHEQTQCEETRLLACPALEAENTVCTLRPEEPEEESYDDRIFIIVFLTCHL